ncbi:MAG: 23S rRNA (adenine(2030)-N(6))-methyltransferase RlmJ [Alphaproteobacteria bacterium]|nr:23S rRNA (adenine(2030)-N(6))-methyltransferase RlmJ [Alphaproteobacteria bacterium]
MNSNLQVISGNYRGRKLCLPAGARPTQNLARGAVFNILAGFLKPDDKIFAWDAFGGSGALGIETLSRYANSTVLFTDLADESVQVIKKNTRDIAANRVRIIKADALNVVKDLAGGVNLVFVDPPYEKANVGPDFVKKLAGVVAFGTIVVQEIENKNTYEPDTAVWEILRDKTYGRARFVFLRRNDKK